MLFVYPAMFHKENNSYWVEFPSLEGCQSFGDTLEETVANAQEALGGYILTVIESNLPLPTPAEISSLPIPDDGFLSLVSCNVNPYRESKSVKKTLTIPSWLNERASAMGLNFSQILQDSLMAHVVRNSSAAQ